MYEKHHHKYDLSIQQGTLAVPGDDQYHVVVNGEIVLSTRVFELAKIIFEEQREELRITAGDPDPREILQRESAGRDIRSLHAESSSNQASPRRCLQRSGASAGGHRTGSAACGGGSDRPSPGWCTGSLAHRSPEKDGTCHLRIDQGVIMGGRALWRHRPQGRRPGHGGRRRRLRHRRRPWQHDPLSG
jgi:hypothetical protein